MNSITVTQSAAKNSTIKPRIAYLDNLKSLMIIFVVIQHVAVTYSGLGIWYYIDHEPLSKLATDFFGFILSFNQAYFMALFFMIAAYFIPPSLEKKGSWKFIRDRLFRLGVPTLIYALVIGPIVEKIANPAMELNLLWLEKDITTFNFLSDTGPMWFALTLLIFSIIYAPLNNLFIKLSKRYSFAVNIKNVSLLIILVTIATFALRLFFPVGTSEMNLQFGFFAPYVFMFCLGIISYRKNLFETLAYKTAKRWFIAAFVAGVPIWALLFTFGLHQAWSGGWNIYAVGHAFWGTFFCITIIIGLVGIFRQHFNTQNSLQKFLSDNAFGVYVFHPLFVVSLSILFKNVHIDLLLEFAIVASIAIPISFIAASLIRKIKWLSKIFA